MKQLIILAFLVPLGGAVQASAAEIHAFSHCPITGVTGYGGGASLQIAEDRAIEDCVAKGGVPDCCRKHFGERK